VTQGKKSLINPVSGGLIALLILGVVLYILFAAEPKSSEDEFSHQDATHIADSNSQEKKLDESHVAQQSRLLNNNKQQSDVSNKALQAFELNYTTKDAFDRFIFARTSEVPQAVKSAYVSHANTVFTPDTANQATDLFSRYVDYKVALSSVELEVDLSNHSLRDVTYKLDEREEIRRAYFNDKEYHYLFSQEAQVDEAALARLRVAQEHTLSKDERKALIVESIKAGSPAEREAFQPTLDMHRINEIKNNHSTINDRYNAVAAEFGIEVAERFSKTWEKQAQWQSKIADYEQYRNDLAQQTLTPGEREEMLKKYQTAHFTDNEIKRLKVLTAQ